MQPPIVVTSMNPFSRQDYQMRCFQAWRALGFEIRTINNEHEAAQLRAQGVAAADIIVAKPEETGEQIFGKGVPRIRSLLYRLEHTYPDRPVVLVNSDIYPAARNSGFIPAFLDQAPALALCREEVPTIETAEFARQNSYRGGLDIFLFSAASLRKVNEILGRFDVSERMCFAIPGWDYMLGAVVCSSEVGGVCMDGGVLLHEKHQQAYGDIAEFQHYVPAMKALGGVSSDDFGAAAEQFANRIQELCNWHLTMAETICASYYLQQRNRTDLSMPALLISRTLCGMAPWVRWNYNAHLIACLAQGRLDTQASDISTSDHFFVRSKNMDHQFGEYLLAVVFELLCRPDFAEKVETDYPKGNLHAAVMRIFDTNLAREKPPAVRLEYARLFGRELVVEKVYNDRLYRYLALACQNDYERKLLAEIGRLVRRERHAA